MHRHIALAGDQAGVGDHAGLACMGEIGKAEQRTHLVDRQQT
jgi:hypothetical protein